MALVCTSLLRGSRDESFRWREARSGRVELDLMDKEEQSIVKIWSDSRQKLVLSLLLSCALFEP